MFVQYISDRFLPDKAIDLIDEAGSRVRLQHAAIPEEAKELDRELRALLKEKDAAVRGQDYEKAREASKRPGSVRLISLYLHVLSRHTAGGQPARPGDGAEGADCSHHLLEDGSSPFTACLSYSCFNAPFCPAV